MLKIKSTYRVLPLDIKETPNMDLGIFGVCYMHTMLKFWVAFFFRQINLYINLYLQVCIDCDKSTPKKHHGFLKTDQPPPKKRRGNSQTFSLNRDPGDVFYDPSVSFKYHINFFEKS